MTIEEQLRNNAIQNPTKIALIGNNTEVTYCQLWDFCLMTAHKLQKEFSIQKGDRVILAAAGSIEFVYVYFGVHIAEGIAVPIDPDTNQTRFNYIKASTMPKCVIGQLHKVEDKTIGLEQVIATEGEKATFISPDENDIADILFTTGTTGAPKGVALSYKNHTAAAWQINTFIGNTAEDVELLALPVSHSFGLGRVRCVLSKGGTLVMLGTFANMKRFFKEMKEHQVTGFGMVPASWGFIKKMSGKYIGKFADQLKYIEIGSSFMSVEEKQLLMELLPKTRICMHYGLTEASRSAFMEFHAEADNLMTAGQASPGVEIGIFSPEGKHLNVGEEGEVCVKGDHVCCNYWNETPERFTNDFYDGYFRTGDAGTMNENGYIYLKSRIKEMINVGGKKVSPMEVEEVLNAMDGIEESACVGVHDDVLGEVVKAYCVCSKEVDYDNIRKMMMKKLENYKIPVFFNNIDTLPKTQNGKLQRLMLK